MKAQAWAVSHTLPCLASPGFVGAWWRDPAMRYLVEVPNFGEFAAHLTAHRRTGHETGQH
jgi:hypothetical protein